MFGTVSYGINNIYSVVADNIIYECRIKGKKLKTDTAEYNPISAGDLVEIEQDAEASSNAMIIRRCERKNSFARWNRKRGRIQTIAANIDLLVCINSPLSPQFRPRFTDRVLVNAEEHYPVLIVMNKIDQGLDESIQRRLNNWADMGYKVMLTSAESGDGIDNLKKEIDGCTAAFVGQSGVGKSSLLNRIEPGLNFRIGDVSGKFNKGTHTTCFAVLDSWQGGKIIDTPGIKEIDPVGISPEDLSYFMRDFREFIGTCAHSVCLHRDEPGCAVKKAVESGKIFKERYFSYLRILSDLEHRIKINRYRKGEF